MINRVLENIRKNTLFCENEHVIAAVSGGADSVCLLILLNELKNTLGIRLSAVHVHHGIRRGTANRDEEYVRTLCGKLGVSLTVKRVDVPAYSGMHHLSTEEAARALRYAAFEETLRETGAKKVALAHHLDDQAETILFRMLRGSGLRGLSGMQPLRDVYVRPLLNISRAEITAFLTERGISWCEDETNDEDEASRNRIRHHVLPAMQEVRMDAVEKIAETGRYLGEIEDFMQQQAEAFLAEHGTETAKEIGGVISISAVPFAALHPALQLYVIRTALEKTGCRMKDKGREHLKQAAVLIDRPVGREICLPGDGYIVRGYDGLTVSRTADAAKASTETDTKGVILGSPDTVCVKKRVFSRESAMKIPEKQYTKWFDYDKITEPVVIRNRQSGDRFSTRPGTHKKLKDYLIDEKIPQGCRDQLLLAASGQEVLWVLGHRMSEAYKVTGQTKTILEICIEIGGKVNEC